MDDQLPQGTHKLRRSVEGICFLTTTHVAVADTDAPHATVQESPVPNKAAEPTQPSAAERTRTNEGFCLLVAKQSMTKQVANQTYPKSDRQRHFNEKRATRCPQQASRGEGDDTMAGTRSLGHARSNGYRGDGRI
jgi:hypothetical protein